jgi:hypothetical protein
MSLMTDPERAQKVGQILLRAYRGDGVLGESSMPEHILPQGLERGSPEYLNFLTLTVAIDYMRDADALWAAGRRTYADPETRYLYSPRRVIGTGISTLIEDMTKYRLAKRPAKDVQQIWQSICLTLVHHFDAEVYNLLGRVDFDAPRLLETIRNPHYRFPYLKGPKIGPLWIRMLEDSWQGHHLNGLGVLPIPVDVHIATATVMTGCVRGPFVGAFEELANAVRTVWFDACRNTPHYPLQLDQPLWHLSRRGCRAPASVPCACGKRCPVGAFCTSVRPRLQAGMKGSAATVSLPAT